MKRLSIIIVTYKSDHDIYDCIQSVWQYCDIPSKELEIIVVDNSPECKKMFSTLRERYQDIILIHNTHNGGYGQGNNVGIRQASAPIVMIMNPDVRICQPVFKTALNAFERDNSLCTYGMKQMLSPTVKSPLSFDCSRRINGYLIPFVASICNKFDIFCPTFMFFAGSCFFISKEKFEEIGLFDEENFMYGEEEDIHFRLKDCFGAHFTYNPSLRYIHQTLERPMSFATEKKMVDSTAYLYAKKGIPAKKTYHNFVRYYRTRLFNTYLKKLFRAPNATTQAAIIKEVIHYCRSVKST
ncbi:MAG: glycosyltransferase [Prevotella sp.]|nr:glycosyltransferase [Prevotella sp.]